MKFLNKLIATVLISLVGCIFVSCSDIIGYSVVLWNVPELELADGTIVPVYLKSNISKVYVITTPNSEQKVEVPLWKLSEPQSKKRAQATALSYAEYQGRYALCILDGLPIRQETKNTSRQVYRLRKGEIIRVLRKGTGDIPTNGTKALEGEWLRVLASDGTAGWCFSHNLELFAMNTDGTFEAGSNAEVQVADELLEKVLATKWYPDYYATMIRKKQIDLKYMKTSYGFDTGSYSGTISLVMDDVNLSYPYSGLTRSSSSIYKFNDTPLQMTIRNADSIIVKYTTPEGMAKSQNFITISDDIGTLIAEEKNRRLEVYNTFQKLGPVYTSSNYGQLTFTGNGSFRWRGYDVLVPSVIRQGLSGEGSIEVKYFLPSSLEGAWDGILTFYFNGYDEVNFLYKKEANGFRMCAARVTTTTDMMTGRDNTNISQSSSAQVIVFHN